MTDTERIDWIERTGASVECVLADESRPTSWAVEWVHSADNFMDTAIRPTLRAAIDEAMEADGMGYRRAPHD